MAKIPKTKWEQAPAGTHAARCIGFVDLGTHMVAFQQQEPKETRLCRIYYDLVNLKTKDGKNMVVFQKYTYSPSPKGNLMKTLKSWLNVKDANFDMADLIGKPALVKVEESKSGEYTNVTTVMEVPKGTKVKESNEQTHMLFLEPDDFDINEFNELPEGLQGTIMDSLYEYAACTAKGVKKKAPAKSAPVKKGKGK